MEYSSAFGFASHNDGLRPCYRCNAQPSAVHDLIGFGLAGFPARENRPEDLEVACDRCEHKVLLDGPSHAKLVAPGVLEYDKRERGKRGLVVVRDPNCLGIKPGMRVEPCNELPNIGNIFLLVAFPVSIVFWIVDNETLVRHRNPLLSPSLGLTMRSCAIDLLHMLYLG